MPTKIGVIILGCAWYGAVILWAIVMIENFQRGF